MIYNDFTLRKCNGDMSKLPRSRLFEFEVPRYLIGDPQREQLDIHHRNQFQGWPLHGHSVQ